MGKSFPVVIVSGLSGSGKTTALHVFEDMGFFTVDGLPAKLAWQMVDMFAGATITEYTGLAFGMDLRQPEFINDYEASLEVIKQKGIHPQLIFIEARPPVLMQRYATTRRPHPLEKEGLGLEQALEEERRRLDSLRKTADLVIDTSDYSVHNLRRAIQRKWQTLHVDSRPMRVHLISFGFKYGAPSEADMMFDLRFLPNPYFVPELKPFSGQDPQVRDFVLYSELGSLYLEKLYDFILFVLTQSEAEGRYRTTLAIGCTGGRHRSVAIAEALAERLVQEKFPTTLEHRHLELG